MVPLVGAGEGEGDASEECFEGEKFLRFGRNLFGILPVGLAPTHHSSNGHNSSDKC